MPVILLQITKLNYLHPSISRSSENLDEGKKQREGFDRLDTQSNEVRIQE